MTNVVFTIGHSNHALESFIELLHTHHVNAVADVRSSPYSRFNPDFNREFLRSALGDRGLVYAFLGRELGARPANPDCYEEGRVQYKRLAQTQLFKEGVAQLLGDIQTFHVALLCAEAEPLACHRTLLLAPELIALGVDVKHIHADGRLESHSEAMDRLIELLGMANHDLYRTKEEIIADAFAIQAKRISYTDEEMREEASA